MTQVQHQLVQLLPYLVPMGIAYGCLVGLLIRWLVSRKGGARYV